MAAARRKFLLLVVRDDDGHQHLLDLSDPKLAKKVFTDMVRDFVAKGQLDDEKAVPVLEKARAGRFEEAFRDLEGLDVYDLGGRSARVTLYARAGTEWKNTWLY